MNKFYVTLGDPSDDGHGKHDKVLLESNKTIEEMVVAYKASCKLTGISFNHNDDFTEIERSYSMSKRYRVCVEYEQSELSEEIKEKLIELECPSSLMEEVKEEVEEDGFVKLLMWFIGLSLEDFEWNILPIIDLIPSLNDSNDLCVQFGYGLYL